MTDISKPNDLRLRGAISSSICPKNHYTQCESWIRARYGKKAIKKRLDDYLFGLLLGGEFDAL